MRTRPARAVLVLLACAGAPLACRHVEVVPGCTERSGVRPVDSILDTTDDPCRDWAEALHVRAARDGSGSGVLWTRRTAAGTGLLLTTAWMGSRCRREASGPDDVRGCEARWSDPREVAGRAEVHLAHPDGGRAQLEARATFHLFEPAQPAPARPRELAPLSSDFLVHVIDGQTFSDDDLLRGARPAPLADLPLELDDPSGSASSAPTWADAQTDARLLAFGYAHGGEEAGRLQASVLRVLGEDEARRSLSTLPPGDVESQVPYDPEVEIVARGEAVVGMGGGGMFDRRGRLVAVLLRSFTPPGGDMHVRAVRMSFIARTMSGTLAALPATEQASVMAYLPQP